MGWNLGFGASGGKEKTSFTQEQTGQQNTKSSSTGQATTTTLDPHTIGILHDVITSLAGTFAGGSPDAQVIRDLSGQLAQNASPAATDAAISASQAEAKRNFAANQGAQISQIQQAVGSRGNSFSQLIAQQGNVDLSSTLANIAAQLRLSSQSEHGQELAAALGGQATAAQVSQGPLQQLLAAITSLTGTETTQKTQEQSVVDALSHMLTKGESYTKTQQKGFNAGLTSKASGS